MILSIFSPRKGQSITAQRRGVAVALGNEIPNKTNALKGQCNLVRCFTLPFQGEEGNGNANPNAAAIAFALGCYALPLVGAKK
jgi:hypothetical protein